MAIPWGCTKRCRGRFGRCDAANLSLVRELFSGGGGGVSLRAGGAKHGVEKAVHESGLRAPADCQHVRCFRQHQQGAQRRGG